MNACFACNSTLSGFDWGALMMDLMGFAMVALGCVGVVLICFGFLCILRMIYEQIRGR